MRGDADPDSDRPAASRAISPTVGVAILIAIVVVLVAVFAAGIYGLAEFREPAPDARFDESTESGPPAVVFRHDGGETVDGETLTVQGGILYDDLDDRSLTVAEAIRAFPVDDTVRVVWEAPNGETTHVLAEREVDREALFYEFAEVTEERDDVDDDVRGGGIDETESDLDVDGNDGVTVEGTLRAEEDVDVDADATVYGHVIARTGSVDLDGDDGTCEVYGDVRANETIDVDGGCVVYGDVEADASVDLDASDATIHGDVRAPGVQLDGSNLTVGGDMAVESDDPNVDGANVVIEGDLVADSEATVDLDGDVTIEGAVVSTDGDRITDVECDGDVRIDGQPCEAYAD